jgi:hypothetical protein
MVGDRPFASPRLFFKVTQIFRASFLAGKKAGEVTSVNFCQKKTGDVKKNRKKGL